MGKYTILDDPAADRAVQDVLDMVVDGVLDLMGDHVKGIVLMGGFGRGEGGIYNDGVGYGLVNDLDLAVFVEKEFSKVKKEYSARLKELAVELQPKARGLKQIDVDITNSRRFRFVPNLVNYYEIKHGHKIVYGDLNLYGIMPSLKSEKLPVFDGTKYFQSKGSCLLLAAVYFATNKISEREIREDFQIEMQKACQAMGDSLLLMIKQYHYSYSERLRLFNLIDDKDNVIPEHLLAKIRPLYRWGIERKLRPSFEWPGDGEMIQRWFELRDVFGEYFLWFESKRLKRDFKNWSEYSDYTYIKGISEPVDVRLWNLIKRASEVLRINKKELLRNGQGFWRSQTAKLLPVMPLLLFSLSDNGEVDEYNINKAYYRLKGISEHKMPVSWLDASIEYLKEFKVGGIIERFLTG